MAYLDILRQIADGLAAQFGENCEIVIHDLHERSPENSIVYIINGHVTGRKTGDGSSGAVLNALKHYEKHGTLTDRLAYLTKTDNGKILKSSTLYIKDETETLRYILSINYDITSLLAIETSIHSLIACHDRDEEKPDSSPKTITHDVNQLLDELIEESVRLVGVPVPLMSKEDKIKAINFLNDAGAFLITKSGDKVAKYFGISKYTLYSYVDINK
ncbi:MAG: helix-turn-helix transcriptional regulator [Eubacterium sp.]|nr:helix-turn-helix transcriptional regulator [Eubacterium sp.]MDD7209828.1 helix-turn-helix transcriptional regulator [Lachnospiraceae bacterium]MDY5497241.1 helix-turn-helix transcriptional regulator [Anaerobutyricum sp.]